mgnify:CR=1 FL=1
MKKLLLFNVLLIVVNATYAQEEENKVNPVQLSLAYPIGTAGVNSIDYSNRLSLNMIYGVNGGVEGLEMGGVANINKGNVNGVQLSGAINANSGNADGVLASGFANVTLMTVKGVQLAGTANYSGNTEGLMMSGSVNWSKALDGFQLSGAMNVAEDVDGGQVSGLLNIAKTVKGVQIAPLLNIADTSDYSIALINLVKSGEKGISVTVDETNTLMLSFRSGGRVTYGIIGAGYQVDGEDGQFAVEAGLGAVVYRGQILKLRTEAVSTTYADWDKETYFRSTFRVLPTFQLGAVELFGGPTLNFIYSEETSGPEQVDNYMWKHTDSNGFSGLYAGFLAGINYRF